MSHEPRAEELIEAVREWIKSEVMPALAGYGQFRARSALSALGTVQRELAQRQAVDGRAQRLFAQRLGFDAPLPELERALCARIRRGELGAQTSGLIAELRELTLARLAIDQPKYPSYVAELARKPRP